MKIKWFLLFFCLFCIFIPYKTDSEDCSDFNSLGINAVIKKYGDWDIIYENNFYLINCIWGKGKITDYEHYIYKFDKDSLFPLGWKWRWPQKDIEQVKAYPSIAFGQNPWADRSTIPQLPRRIDQINEIIVTYDITHCVSGKYNLSFDLWITKTPEKTSPPEVNIIREVMIWQDYKGQGIPNSWFRERVTIDGEIYKFYKAKNITTQNYTRDYMAFLKEIPEHKGETKIQEFFKYLVEHNHVMPNEYLRNVDLGNEIWYGSGETILNDYSISIK